MACHHYEGTSLVHKGVARTCLNPPRLSMPNLWPCQKRGRICLSQAMFACFEACSLHHGLTRCKYFPKHHTPCSHDTSFPKSSCRLQSAGSTAAVPDPASVSPASEVTTRSSYTIVDVKRRVSTSSIPIPSILGFSMFCSRESMCWILGS